MTRRCCLFLLATLLYACPALAAPPKPVVTLGVDVLLGQKTALIEGKRLGIVTNSAAVDGNLVTTLERLRGDSRWQVTQLYAPEHGIAGALHNGNSGESGLDPETGLPIEGLFTRGPSVESLDRVDVVIFDLQDIGSRTYTYVTTLGQVMRACAEFKKPLLVLDRPNPRGGLQFEGPIRLPKYKSLIGWGPLPVTHGMTVGEMAQFYKSELNIACDLTVVPMQGWRRDMVWEDTGLHWIPTSPGIPHPLNAHLYVATGMVGGSGPNVNEGGGMSMPFELIGAPWIEPKAFAAALEAEKLPGLRFRPMTFLPRRGQFANKVTHGVQVLLQDPRELAPLRTALTILVTLKKLHPDQLTVKDRKRFGRVWGNDEVLRLIDEGKSVAEIEATWAGELAAFGQKRAKVLIYPSPTPATAEAKPLASQP
jgi:uncharacterized protein YbbC (DUF1343 family)